MKQYLIIYRINTSNELSYAPRQGINAIETLKEFVINNVGVTPIKMYLIENSWDVKPRKEFYI